MTLNYKYTFRDLYLFQLAHLKYKNNRWFSLNLGLLFAVQAALVKLLNWSDYLVLANGLLAVLIAFPQILLFFITYLRHRRFKKYRRQLKLKIGPKQFKIETEHSKASSDWQDFIDYRLYKNKLVILYRSPQHALLIPKRVVKKKDWPKLLALLTEKIEPEPKPKKTIKTLAKIIILVVFALFIASEVELFFRKNQTKRANELNNLRQELQDLQQEQWWLEQELGMSKEEIQTAKANLARRVTVFFKPGTSPDLIMDLKNKLEAYQLTTSISYTSQQQAAQNFSQYGQEEDWPKDILTEQELAEILPASLELEVSNKAAVLGLLNELKNKYMIEDIETFD